MSYIVFSSQLKSLIKPSLVLVVFLLLCSFFHTSAQAQESVVAINDVVDDGRLYISSSVTNDDERVMNLVLGFTNETDIDFDHLRYGFTLLAGTSTEELAIVDQSLSNKRFSLAAGESLELETAYFKPDFVTGEYTLYVGLYNRSTSMVSGAVIGETSTTRASSTINIIRDSCVVSGSEAVPNGQLIVDPESEITVTCNVENTSDNDVDLSLFVRTIRQSIFGDIVKIDEIESQSSVSADSTGSVDFTFTTPATPQQYYSQLILETDIDLFDTDFIEYQVAGDFAATINKVSFSKKAYKSDDIFVGEVDWVVNDLASYYNGIAVPTTTAIDLPPGIRVSLLVNDKEGASCLEPTEILLGTSTEPVILTSKFSKSCSDYDVIVELSNNQTSAQLDRIVYSVAMSESDKENVLTDPVSDLRGSNNIILIMVFSTVIILILIMIIISAIYRRQKPQETSTETNNQE